MISLIWAFKGCLSGFGTVVGDPSSILALWEIQLAYLEKICYEEVKLARMEIRSMDGTLLRQYPKTDEVRWVI
jgi:hypothetical protein